MWTTRNYSSWLIENLNLLTGIPFSLLATPPASGSHNPFLCFLNINVCTFCVWLRIPNLSHMWNSQPVSGLSHIICLPHLLKMPQMLHSYSFCSWVILHCMSGTLFVHHLLVDTQVESLSSLIWINSLKTWEYRKVFWRKKFLHKHNTGFRGSHLLGERVQH